MKKLSDKQNRILQFLKKFITENGYPPAIRDIQSGCGISSTSVVDYNLSILEKEGYIRRQSEVSRGITMTNRNTGTENTISIPIIGLIAAGEPIPVPTPDTWNVAATSETLEIPRELSGNREDVYALRVKGTSMIDALINDGDVVFLTLTGELDEINPIQGEDVVIIMKKGKK